MAPTWRALLLAACVTMMLSGADCGKRRYLHREIPWEVAAYDFVKFTKCFLEHLLRLLENDPQAENDMAVKLQAMGFPYFYLKDFNLTPTEAALRKMAEEATGKDVNFDSCPCESCSASRERSCSRAKHH